MEFFAKSGYIGGYNTAHQHCLEMFWLKTGIYEVMSETLERGFIDPKYEGGWKKPQTRQGFLVCFQDGYFVLAFELVDLIFELQEAKDTNMRRYTICFSSAGGKCGRCRWYTQVATLQVIYIQVAETPCHLSTHSTTLQRLCKSRKFSKLPKIFSRSN